ncbi:hypothetical protein CEUSTIGMA_g10298.t1 [Chlamydomonas eustigma]|uniref:glutamate--tRNA ligase n=1 Tax=Chlamydomonas eustigma TaxID=1157962 RepID=A0A250XIY6_9CHLO|nr:hypothetical protein CEUSTIGMA_g10298.t1 [Chlamydomonas eustigma]|eukprot:GAX82872.1 hypothetical protein CEUSTIGMA_g10298.t1 [Chlamydomonas eustigma]
MSPCTLSFWDKNPPLAAVSITKLSALPLEIKSDPKGNKDTAHCLTFPSGDQFVGSSLILRYLARSAPPELNLYDAEALGATQIDYWIDYSVKNVAAGANFEAVCHGINDYLALRTFLVGYNLTVADIALWGQLQVGTMWLKVKAKTPHLSRWFDHVAALPECKSTVEELDLSARRKAIVAADGSADPKKGGGDTGSFDIGLPGAKMGQVVTRFPPEPSGYLHIGHAKAALLNQYFADMYQGKLLVRFDDTNPSKEKDEFVENILRDIADLGLKYEKLTHTSDYFPQLEDLGERLIKSGIMYADDTPVDLMREERMAKIESKCRGRSVEENLRIWQEMKKGSDEGLANAMRLKIDMKSENGCMRDPVTFRCNQTPHWRTGTKYKMYPTYDFACPFTDALEGVTHALRTSEYKDREEQFYWILKAQQKVWPGLPDVHIWDYSRLNFIYTLLSKRKLTWFVETKRVEGWNDPRMPTVQGILRRGLKIESLKEFILSQGASRNVTYQEWDKIWTINKKNIDPVCPRHTAIEAPDRVSVTLTNGPSELEVVTVLRHKKYPPAGKKSQLRLSKIWLDQADAQEIKEGEEVTLMDWGNMIVKKIHKREGSECISSIDAELFLEGDFKKTKWKLTWLAQVDELVELQLSDFDYLVTKRKLEDDDLFEDHVNNHTRHDRTAWGDSNMRTLQKGDIIQLERKGYFIVDEPLTKPGKPVVLFSIPDGRERKAFPGAPAQGDAKA